MRAIIERHGPCRIQYGEPCFASLAETIVYQQLNGKAAATIFKRFADLAGQPLLPTGVLKLSDEQMRAAGLSKQKLSYLRSLAELTLSGALNFEQLPSLANEEVIAHLTQVKGIGIWSAQMFLMFTLRRPVVLPTGDLGLPSLTDGRVQNASCPSPRRWRRLPGRGRPTGRMPAGICGGAWIRRKFPRHPRKLSLFHKCFQVAYSSQRG